MSGWFSNLKELKGSIFIVTYGRSGSTVLQSLLQSIPGAHIVGENYATLEPLYRAANRVRRSKATWGKEELPKNHPWFGAARLEPVRFEHRMAELFVKEIIQPPMDARWIGFKEIRHPALGDDLGDYLDFMRGSFPNAHFVFNSRNARDVAKSTWWAKMPETEVTETLEAADARFRAYAAAHPDYAAHVQFEDVVADPASLRGVFDMLGEKLNLRLAKSILKVRLEH